MHRTIGFVAWKHGASSPLVLSQINQCFCMKAWHIVDKILIVRFEDPSTKKMEERTYDFRTKDGRHAFLRFSSWALNTQFIFSCGPAPLVQAMDSHGN
jgi:hypothetical protein